MIRGVGKHIVVINNPKSEYFEQAIFIIKDGLTSNETDILAECEKIIKHSSRINLKTSKLKDLIRKSIYLTLITILIATITIIFNTLM